MAFRHSLTGLDKNTLVIFTTDHGLAMPRAKGTCYDPGIEVAMLMYKPNEFEGSTSYGELLSNVDILPTLLEYVGTEIPEGLDGQSFLPLLKNESYAPRESIFAEMTWHDRYNPMRAIRTNQYKYIRNFGQKAQIYIPADIFKSPAGREIKDEFYSAERQAEEMYDLKNDPCEKHNLVNEEAYSSVLQDLRQQVQQWMEQTKDPLLLGAIEPIKKQVEKMTQLTKQGTENQVF